MKLLILDFVSFLRYLAMFDIQIIITVTSNCIMVSEKLLDLKL